MDDVWWITVTRQALNTAVHERMVYREKQYWSTEVKDVGSARRWTEMETEMTVQFRA